MVCKVVWYAFVIFRMRRWTWSRPRSLDLLSLLHHDVIIGTNISLYSVDRQYMSLISFGYRRKMVNLSIFLVFDFSDIRYLKVVSKCIKQLFSSWNLCTLIVGDLFGLNTSLNRNFVFCVKRASFFAYHSLIIPIAACSNVSIRKWLFLITSTRRSSAIACILLQTKEMVED